MKNNKQLWLGVLGATLLAPQVVYADISGKVFRDFNTNGTLDTNEVGIANVTVKAFDPSGAQAATAVSATDGAYTMTLATGTDYRVEFTWGEDWLQPAAAGGTSVQFVQNGASSINFALHNPAQTVAPGQHPVSSPQYKVAVFITAQSLFSPKHPNPPVQPVQPA